MDLVCLKYLSEIFSFVRSWRLPNQLLGMQIVMKTTDETDDFHKLYDNSTLRKLGNAAVKGIKLTVL